MLTIQHWFRLVLFNGSTAFAFLKYHACHIVRYRYRYLVGESI